MNVLIFIYVFRVGSWLAICNYLLSVIFAMLGSTSISDSAFYTKQRPTLKNLLEPDRNNRHVI